MTQPCDRVPTSAVRRRIRFLLALGGAWLVSLAVSTSVLADEVTDYRSEKAGKLVLSKSTGMRLGFVRAGAFEMGSPTTEDGHSRQEAQHIVRITRPFYIGICEVTQAEFEQIMDSNPSEHSRIRGADRDTSRFPVENVTWFDAVEFCNLLSDKDGLKPYYSLADIERVNGEKSPIKSAVVAVAGGSGYRLPTEAEWEYACRAGTSTAFCSGQTVATLNRFAWHGGPQNASGNSDQQSHAVGLKSGNDFGLFDMHGNVSEWCYDWYDARTYDRSPANDPPGPSGGSEHVIRGGSWDADALLCRSAARLASAPNSASASRGFRVARSVPSQNKKPNSVPPYRIVMDLNNGSTVDVFNNETYDSIDSAKERLYGSKLFGRIDSLRIIDGNGNPID